LFSIHRKKRYDRAQFWSGNSQMVIKERFS
jgi:hypothetical protein